MYAIPWHVALLFSFPESFFIVLLGLRLIKIDINLYDAAIIGAIGAIAVYITRQLFIPFGIHTLLGIVILTLTTVYITKIKLWHSLIAILIGMIILLLIESIVLGAFMTAGIINVDTLKDHSPIIGVIFAIKIVITTCAYIIITMKKLFILDIKTLKTG